MTTCQISSDIYASNLQRSKEKARFMEFCRLTQPLYPIWIPEFDPKAPVVLCGDVTLEINHHTFLISVDIPQIKQPMPCGFHVFERQKSYFNIFLSIPNYAMIICDTHINNPKSFISFDQRYLLVEEPLALELMAEYANGEMNEHFHHFVKDFFPQAMNFGLQRIADMSVKH